MNFDTINTEKALLLRVANDDQEAFSLLINSYSNKVFSHALTYLKSYHEAEEHVQDIFMKVWTNRKQLSTITEFKNYLFILGRNQLISAIRKKALDTDVLSDLNHLPEGRLVPDRQYQSKETYHKIIKGVNRLSPQQRSVFTLSRLENLSHEEISTRLGISKRTVKFHLVLALNALREFLHEADYPRLVLIAYIGSYFV